MTLEETQKVLAYVTAAYPRYFANVTQESARNMGKVWTDALMEIGRASCRERVSIDV